MRRRQQGLSAIFVIIVIIAVAAVFLALITLFRNTAGAKGAAQTQANLAAAANALEQYAAIAGRLPCPANPSSASGEEDPKIDPPGPPPATCNSPAGSLPWRTIGLRSEDALDSWGWKISYRVYTGAAGSLTQGRGASMVDCEIDETTESTPAGKDPSGLCRTTHDTIASEFLAGKGLVVNDSGTVRADAAYVLISHGPTGLGAFTSTGGQRVPLPELGGDERANSEAAGPFVARLATTGIPQELAAHFDDVLVYRPLAEMVKRAALSPRNWPDGLASTKLDATAIAAALGTAPAYGDLGRASLNFPNARVTAFNSSGNQNLALVSAGGVDGLGGVGGGDGRLQSGLSEGLKLEFSSLAGKFAVTLNQFGTGVDNAIPYSERAEFRFFNGLNQVSVVSKNGCRPDGGLASFSIDAGAAFDKVEIRALTSTVSTIDSAFLVSEFVVCAAEAATCVTGLSDPPANNTCP